MAVGIDRGEESPRRAGLGAVALGPECGERLGVNPLPFRVGEGRVAEDVGRQVEHRVEVRRQALEAEVGAVPAGAD